MDLRELAAQLAAEAAEQPQEATGGAGEGKPPVMLQREQERRIEAEKKALEVYKEYQKNIRNSESAQTTILKGLQAGENPYKLLLSACECIGYLTSNKAFSEMARGNILEIVGKGLLQPEDQARAGGRTAGQPPPYRGSNQSAPETGRGDRAGLIYSRTIRRTGTQKRPGFFFFPLDL